MGCTLNDFKVTGDFRTKLLADGRTLRTAKAETKYMGTAGVLYWIEGKFQGFTGTEEAAEWWAEKR